MISRYKMRPNVQEEPDDCIQNAVILCAETIMDSVMYVRRNTIIIIRYFMGADAPDKDD